MFGDLDPVFEVTVGHLKLPDLIKNVHICTVSVELLDQLPSYINFDGMVSTPGRLKSKTFFTIDKRG